VRIIGIGVDLVHVSRMRSVAERWRDRFLVRVYTETERRDCLRRVSPYASLAGRFAAKEAILKALGTGWTAGIRWVDIQVANDDAGRPVASVSGRVDDLMRAAGVTAIHVSLSHDGDYAIAHAILTAEP
jgi:holo-[acyl-carrier protein] synthase